MLTRPQTGAIEAFLLHTDHLFDTKNYSDNVVDSHGDLTALGREAAEDLKVVRALHVLFRYLGSALINLGIFESEEMMNEVLDDPYHSAVYVHLLYFNLTDIRKEARAKAENFGPWPECKAITSLEDALTSRKEWNSKKQTNAEADKYRRDLAKKLREKAENNQRFSHIEVQDKVEDAAYGSW